MFRALSTRRGPRGYEQLGHEPSSTETDHPVPKLNRANSLPAKILRSCSNKLAPPAAPATTPSQQVKKASKVHPLFSLFETRRKKKATAKPEFSRYLEYVREGGTWDMNANMPVIYYK